MKARLAKKLAHTPLARLASTWLKRIFRGDARVVAAANMWDKKANRPQTLEGEAEAPRV